MHDRPTERDPPRSPLAAAWQACFEREPATFAVGLRLTTIAVVLWLSLEIDLRWAHLPKSEVVSVAGLLVPETWWSAPAALWAGRAALWGGALLWLHGRWRRLGAWSTTLGMLWLGSLYWEDLPWFRHKMVPPFWLLVLLVAAEHARVTDRRGLAPRWVREGAVFALAAFYVGAGAQKLLASGLRWGDGVALQLWLERLGDRDSLVRAWVIENASVAALLASVALALELAVALAVPLPRLRPWLAAAIIALHVGIDRVLHIDFRSNIVLVAVVLLPWPNWVGASRRILFKG